jgi:L-ascorbate metabolism protein UlaG (beta-lactamase superfamily)
MRIWKLYNHGFFVRTPNVSFAFDVVPGPPGIQDFAVTAGLLERIAVQADALFLSHPHNDHVNRDVARMFLTRNKPVLAPEGLWAAEPEFAGKLTYPKRSASEVLDVPVRAGKQVLKLTAYPGHQGASPINNVNLVVTPEGFAVIHTGDQSGNEGPGSDFDWIAHIGHNRPIDVALPNCWTTDIKRVLRGIDPRLVITGQENEMAHEVPHREDYTQTYNHLAGSPYPVLVMTWGESYWYRRP